MNYAVKKKNKNAGYYEWQTYLQLGLPSHIKTENNMTFSTGLKQILCMKEGFFSNYKHRIILHTYITIILPSSKSQPYPVVALAS